MHNERISDIVPQNYQMMIFKSPLSLQLSNTNLETVFTGTSLFTKIIQYRRLLCCTYSASYHWCRKSDSRNVQVHQLKRSRMMCDCTLSR